MFRQKLFTAALLAPFVIHGCAVVDFAEDHHTVAYITTNQATMRVIEHANNSKQWAKRTIAITEDVKSMVGGKTITLDELFEYVYSKIDWKSMEPANKSLLDTVLTEAERRLEQRINNEDGLNKNDRIKVQTFIGWVQKSAEDYVRYEVTTNG